MHPILTIAAILCALGAVEATAYWWMNPAPSGLGEPVLVYRPQVKAETLKTEMLNEESLAPYQPPAPSASSIQQSKIKIRHSSIDSSTSPLSESQRFSVSAFTITPLPDVYQQAAPMLRCTGGQVFHSQLNDTVGLHLAFFEWDGADTGSVLEAFRHMPEACMGSIGMKLVSKEKPIFYTVRERETGSGGQESEVRGQRSANATAHSASPIQNSTSNIQNSLQRGETLLFDHTVFREPGKSGGLGALGPQVHAFRAVWVAGMTGSDARKGIGGDEFNRLRTIRLKSAVSRFRPTHARVIQGAVRGAANGEAAWQAFEQAMLNDLIFQ